MTTTKADLIAIFKSFIYGSQAAQLQQKAGTHELLTEDTGVHIREALREELSKPIFRFQRYGGSPVLDVGAAGAWDDYRLADPSLIKVGNTFYIFYEGSRDATVGIGYAVSDDLVLWRRYGGNPILTVGGAGTWEVSIGQPNILLHDGIYYLFYTGTDAAGWLRVGFATSLDMVTWTKYTGNPVFEDGGIAQAPCVVFNPADHLFYMFYQDEESKQKYAVSTNLVNWTMGGTALPRRAGLWDTMLGKASVKRVFDDFWVMAYGGKDVSQRWTEPKHSVRIGLAFSNDLKSWTRFNGNPVVDYESGQSWEYFNIYGQTLLIDNGIIYLFYNALGRVAGLDRERIGFVYCPINIYESEKLIRAHGYFQDDADRSPWKNKTIGINAETYPVWALGYPHKMVEFTSDTTGTLTIYADVAGDGDWRVYSTEAITLNVTKPIPLMGDMAWIKLAFNQVATVTAKIIME